MKQAIKPGVTELQLWGLINYTNLANNGDWHDGRMLASGPRINPWLQEATQRRVESGDLVGVDTDMIGPFGYCADISRTFHCGPGKPTPRQKELYQLAVSEIEYNLKLIRPGMCDEWPRVDPIFRGPIFNDAALEPGMVLCVESFIGAVGEPNGVKLEQQVLVTEAGYELLSTYPLDEELLT